MNVCKDCIVDMICIKKCPTFKIDLKRLQSNEELYLTRCFNNIKNITYKKISENIKVEICDGYIWWFKNGKVHRDNDQPALIKSNGDKFWYKNGKRHRDNDQPAVIESDGSQYWYKDGNLHRDNDQPAIIYSDGCRYWYKNGKRHRDNDQPAVLEHNGIQNWYKNGVEYEPMQRRNEPKITRYDIIMTKTETTNWKRQMEEPN